MIRHGITVEGNGVLESNRSNRKFCCTEWY